MSECKTDKYGNKRWYSKNKLHREDGPAIEWSGGDKTWWLHSKEYTEAEFILLQFSKGIIIDE